MCVAGNSVITSDDGIYLSCLKNNVPVLKICQGHIRLDGYDYGFIGGASGQISDNTIFFAGDITVHPDFEKISEFLKFNNIKFLSVPKVPLVDVGSVIELCI